MRNGLFASCYGKQDPTDSEAITTVPLTKAEHYEAQQSSPRASAATRPRPRLQEDLVLDGSETAGCCLFSCGTANENLSASQQRRLQKLVERLRKEQPRDLGGWLRAYAQEIDGVRMGRLSPATPATPASEFEEDSDAEDEGEIHRMLNWRFFLIQKEREVAETSARQLSERAMKWRLEGHTPFSRMGKHLSSFVPDVVKRAIRTGDIAVWDSEQASSHVIGAGKSAYDPLIKTMIGAVVFADASGFTALTERFAKHPKGGEKLAAYLNDFFGPLINIIHSHGGDILKFSGDALTILWPAHTDTDNNLGISSIASAHMRSSATITSSTALPSMGERAAVGKAALMCCLEMQEHVTAAADIATVNGIALQLHIGVGFGELSILQIGGIFDRWEYCATGLPLAEVAIGEELAKPGEVVVSPSTQAVLLKDPSQGRGFKFEEIPHLQEDRVGYRLLSKENLLSYKSSLSTRLSYRPARAQLTDEDSVLVQRYIPRAMATSPEALGSRLDEDDFTSEMRRISVIFLVLRGLNPGRRNRSDCNRTHLLLRLFQRACYALEGSINKFIVDDKGMLLLTVFGLPPLCHYVDDPTRAVLYAQRLCETARDEGVEAAAGVTTGQCWCGVIGTQARREYSVLGDVVNLSARLMARAGSGEVLVDLATYEASSEFLNYISLGDMRVKGKEDPVDVFQFVGTLVRRDVREARQLESPLLSWQAWPGKDIALQAVKAQLDGDGGVLFIQGAPGSGKTQIVQHVRSWAEGHGYAVLRGQNLDPTSTFSVAMRCWQEVFQDLMRLACDDQRWQAPLSHRRNSHVRRKTQGGRLNFKSHMREGRDIYKLVTRMLVDAGASEDLVQWVPLLSLVIPGFTVGLRGVFALLERDERNTMNVPKLAQLCMLLIDVFNRHCSGVNGTVVLLHLRRGTSFYTQTHLHDGHIARELGCLCAKRRQEGADGRPLVFVVVSRQEVLPDKALLEQAKDFGGHVRVGNLSRDDTERYMRHVLLGPDSEGKPGIVQSSLVDHVYDTTGGNPFSIEELSRDLEKRGVLQREPISAPNSGGKKGGGALEVAGWNVRSAPKWDHRIRLQGLPYPETLRGIAISVFERLSTGDKVLLKSAAVCSKERVDGSDAVTLTTLAASMGMSEAAAVEKQCERLVENEILREVMPPAGKAQEAAMAGIARSLGNAAMWKLSMRKSSSDRLVLNLPEDKGRSFTFASQLILDVALRLVLESQKERMMQRRSSLGAAEDRSPSV